MPDFRTLATVRHHDMVLDELEFDVPLDHDRPSGEKLAVFEHLLAMRRDAV